MKFVTWLEFDQVQRFAVTQRDLRAAARLLVLSLMLAPVVAACSSDSFNVPHVKRAAFTSKEFGVKASPRVTHSKTPPRGGGRYVVGQPYVVRGETYEPLANPIGYVESGTASWYGADFHGRLTANGEIFAATAITCASPVLPLPSYVRVTNLDNGRSIVCRVNDRGPYLHGRVMDLSYRTAAILGYADKGIGNIQVQYIGPAPLEGDDTRMLLASVDRLTRLEQGNTRLASVGKGQGGDIVGGLLSSMFGYAAQTDTTNAVDSSNAIGAAAALASAYVAADLVDATVVPIDLGTYADSAKAEAIGQRFAYLGAVERIDTPAGVSITLEKLKPGVAREDVSRLARELGFTNFILY